MVYFGLHWRLGKVALVYCCIAHCVHHQRASLRSVVNSNKINTHEHTLTWSLPWHSDTCTVCSDFSSQSKWAWYILRLKNDFIQYLNVQTHNIRLITTHTELYLVVEALSSLHSPSCVLQQWPLQWWCSMYCSGGQWEWSHLLLGHCMSCREDSPPPSGW